MGGHSGCAGVRFRFRVAFGATKPLPSRPQNILNCPEMSLHNPRNSNASLIGKSGDGGTVAIRPNNQSRIFLFLPYQSSSNEIHLFPFSPILHALPSGPDTNCRNQHKSILPGNVGGRQPSSLACWNPGHSGPFGFRRQNLDFFPHSRF